MAQHLSLRLPWHDRGWDGHVCDRPTANVYCAGEYGLKAHGIREGKSDDQEEKLRGMPLQVLREDGYRPPCLRTIQTFGGTVPLPFAHEPKEFLHTRRVQIDPIAEKIDPCTAGTWPYDRVFRRAEDADEGTADEFLERYTPDEAVQNIKSFFGQFKPARSLVFFYLNYDNPLNSERRRYVLVGAAEIDAISEQHHWEQIDAEKERVYGSMVWNRFVTHGYDDGRGARIPYDRYLRKELDPSDVLVEIPDDLAHHFKYVCRAFTDDEAAMLLRMLLRSLERGRDAKQVDWHWDREITWINRALESVLRHRGLFPGIGAVLGTLGFPNATLYAEYQLRAKGVANPRQHVLDRIADPKSAETPAAAKGFEGVANVLRLLPSDVRELLFDRLCLFELTTEQVRLIAGGDLVNQDDRRAAGLLSSPSALRHNPYLIVEEYNPVDHDERVPFHRIDHGIYLAKASGGNLVPGLDGFTPDDRRRLRAAAVLHLREVAMLGHSFLSQDELLKALSRMRLSGVPESLGPITLAQALAFYEERLAVLPGTDTTGWMLRTLWEDEDLIRARILKLQQRNPMPVVVPDWAAHLPVADPARVSAAKAEEIRISQARVLDLLATRALSILIGGAGTGKTTVLATLIKGLAQSPKKEKFVLLTPTGKAAVRLRRKIQEVAGIDLEPRTIHSYLMGRWVDEVTFRPRREGEPIDDGATTIVIDECSMLDTTLLATVLRAINWGSVRRLVLSGDPQQLPPIGVGAPFKNLVDHLESADDESQRPRRLIVNCRQVQENSTALRLAEQFTPSADRVLADELLEQVRNVGRVGEDLEVRFFKDEKDLPETLTRLFADAVDELLALEGESGHWDTSKPWAAFDLLHAADRDVTDGRLDALEIISPYRGNYFGSDAVNTLVQSLLRGRMMKAFGTLKLGKPSGRQFVARDKVLQVRNRRVRAKERLAWDGRSNVDFFVANGELGRMMTVEKTRDGKLGRVRFETNPRVSVAADGKWAEEYLDLGYAMTVHKAQGSDFGGVIVVLPREKQLSLCSRELLYTALTRFTRRLYLLVQGQPGDVEPLVAGLWRGASEYLRRNTCLYTVRHAPSDLEEFRPDKRVIRTLRDDLVASKSEALIANLLALHRVPYYYERLLIGHDGTPRRPDFTVSVETPDGPLDLYWEHWGKLGDPGYDATVARRREWYARNGLGGPAD